MKRILPLVIVAATFTFTQADPICIVGAGPAGLTVANGLQAKGFETVIFEKNPEVGGKCQAYYDELGLFHPLGAILFSNETYRQSLPIIDASGLTSMEFGHTTKNWYYDYKTGHVKRSTTSLSELTKSHLFKAEIDRYIHFWTTEFAPLASIGYKGGVEGYTMSTLYWLLENDYPLLLLLFFEGMIPYGYGDVTEVPIIYMLQYFTPDILLFFAGQRTGYIIDFHQVFVHYARDQVKGPIHLNTQITKIDRSGDFPVVTYKDPSQNGLSTQNCAKLVLAFPPVMHALQAANLDINDDEKTIFSPVGIIKYWSGAVRVATPYGDVFAGFLRGTILGVIDKFIGYLGLGHLSFGEFIPWLPKAAGEPVAYIRLFKESDVATTWSWGKYKSNQTLADAKSLLKDVLSRFNKDPEDPNSEPVPVTDADIKDFREWDYFPHFDQPQLEQGFYAKFNALQGHKNTYYASGLNGFETVEFAVRAGKDVVDTYFDSVVLDSDEHASRERLLNREEL
jgi:hypothetical protein